MLLIAAISMVFVAAPTAEADLVRGVYELLGGVLQLPLQTLAGTFSGPPVVGTVFGALNGVMRGAGMVTHGALELASSGFSIAKAVAPFVLPFLF